MKINQFQVLTPHIAGNKNLRIPQSESFEKLTEFSKSDDNSKSEAGIVLPVGCGKSGCIALTPFAFHSMRTLVVAPNIQIAEQLYSEFDPSNRNSFYLKCKILKSTGFPEPVEIRGTEFNLKDLELADVVITNIQQLQREDNRWLTQLPEDFFDLIIFDEGHHSTAQSWINLKNKFKIANIINFSATPLRTDGKVMSENIIYSYSVSEAIKSGYVKRLNAVMLNPKKLRYVRKEDNTEVEVDLEEVIRLGEDDSDFRRCIVCSEETLKTIVDASINKLEELKERTGENRLKIIASALNFAHCHQIVAAYQERGLKTDFVHANLDSKTNKKVIQKLQNNELEVIVQVRKLGEGFDHPFLSVAAIFSVFSNLTPFVQFVGRIMRAIDTKSLNDEVNKGSVVFHAGSNVARRWNDFREFSEADQSYFEQLLPIENLDFSSIDEIVREPNLDISAHEPNLEVVNQELVTEIEIPLLENEKSRQLLEELLKRESPEQITQAINELSQKGYEHETVGVSKAKIRQASRKKLENLVRNEVGKILASQNINSVGKELKPPRSNFEIVKSCFDKNVNNIVGHQTGERKDFEQTEYDLIFKKFNNITKLVTEELFHGKN